jgi:hypothetical protein
MGCFIWILLQITASDGRLTNAKWMLFEYKVSLPYPWFQVLGVNQPRIGNIPKKLHLLSVYKLLSCHYFLNNIIQQYRITAML